MPRCASVARMLNARPTTGTFEVLCYKTAAAKFARLTERVAAGISEDLAAPFWRMLHHESKRTIEKLDTLRRGAPQIRHLGTAPFTFSEATRTPESEISTHFEYLARHEEADAVRIYILALTGARPPEWAGLERLGYPQLQACAAAIGRGDRGEIARQLESSVGEKHMRQLCARFASKLGESAVMTPEWREWVAVVLWTADECRQEKIYAARMIERNYQNFKWRRDTLMNPRTSCGKIFLACRFAVSTHEEK